MKTKKYSLEIKEDYENDYLESRTLIYTYKDSIIAFTYYYKNNNEIKSYYITTTTKNNITSKWKTEGYGNNEERNDIIQNKYRQ